LGTLAPLAPRSPGARSEATLREAVETATPTPPAPAGPPAESLAEALSFLDLPSALDLFDQVASETAPVPAPQAESGVDGSLKVMPPLVVKRLTPPSGPGAPPMAAAANGVPVPRLVLQPPVPPLPRLDPDADTRPGPGLRVALPPGIDGDLELQVVVRHRGEVVAQASALVPATGIDSSGLAVEWKRV
jgi:hypothetical protein